MRRQHRGPVLARQPISEHFALETCWPRTVGDKYALFHNCRLKGFVTVAIQTKAGEMWDEADTQQEKGWVERDRKETWAVYNQCQV